MSFSAQQQRRVRRAMSRVAGRNVYLETLSLADALELARRTSDGNILKHRNVGQVTLRLIRAMSDSAGPVCPACGRLL